MKTGNRSKLGRLGGLIAPLLFVFGGCSKDAAKDTRPARESFGSEIYGILCERVGAQALHEDLTGASYEAICKGTADKVDVAELPPAPDAKVRQLAVAKIEALGRHRIDLVAALETVFPEDSVVGKNLAATNPAATCDPVSGQSRRDQLRELLTRLLPTKTENTVPESSRALALSIEPLTEAQSLAARTAIAHVAARRGYMPAEMETGLLGSLLTAPHLRDTLAATMHLISPDSTPYDKPNTAGTGHDTLNAFFTALKSDLAEPLTEDAPLGTLFDQPTGQTLLSRPRTTLELFRAAMLTENPVFANGGSPLWVAKRDRRGMAVVSLTDGKVPSPFVDANNDGLADIDKLGRFLLAPNAKAPPDPFVGDDKNAIYEYTDARATGAAAVLRHIAPLADPDSGHEALVAALASQEPLLRAGGREALLDVIHAAGQAAADPGTDDLLALLGQYFVKEPQLMARLTGNLLDAKATFDAHPEAVLPEGSTMIDDVLAVLVKISREPGLLEEVLASMADDRSVFLQQTAPALFSFNDRLTYDRNAINGTPKNTTTGGNEPTTLVDRTQPNTGWNRSLFQRFLSLIHDTKGVTHCNKEGAILHAMAQLPSPDGSTNPDGTPVLTWQPAPFPFGGTASACQLLRIEDLSKFYLRSIVGQATIHFRNELLTPLISPDAIFRSTNLTSNVAKGSLWDTPQGVDIKPSPQFLNRLVFFDVAGDSANAGDPLPPPAWPPFPTGFAPPNGQTNFTVAELQGAHIPSASCAETVIDDPNVGDPDVDPDNKIHGYRPVCQKGQSLYELDNDTIFALEFFHGYDALTPLTGVFVKHQKEDLLLELLEVLYKHWNVQGGVANAEPALAQILASDMIPSLNKLTKMILQAKVTRCAESDCSTTVDVPAGVVVAEGIRSLIDPNRAAGITDRRGGVKTANGSALTILGMFRDALDAEDAVLQGAGTIDQWHAARSRIVDEFLTINGRGDDAKFSDPGVAAMVPALVDLVRSQRLARCGDGTDCPALRKQLALDVEDSLKSDIFGKSLDLLNVFLADATARRQIGLMVSYITRQGDALGGVSVAPSSTPFATTTARSPGALDQSIAATVDALGAFGDLKEIRPLYPILSAALDHVDPQLALLSQLNARAYDGAGHEICSRELDPDEAIQNTLTRITMSVTVPGQAKRSALQIFLEAMSDVNRIDASATTPLDGEDYANVFKNVHELLTDPTSGLEQLYATVKQATEH